MAFVENFYILQTAHSFCEALKPPGPGPKPGICNQCSESQVSLAPDSICSPECLPTREFHTEAISKTP